MYSKNKKNYVIRSKKVIDKRKNKKSNKRINKRINKRSNNMGGKPIDSGGFGCVFYPAIKCKGANSRTDGISKLMFEDDAEEEYSSVLEIKPILEKIPNHKQYFILTDITICDPDMLEKEDLINIDSVCDNLKKQNINSKNIKKNLHLFKILNLPFGGKDLNRIIPTLSNKNLLIKINSKLVEILVNAIIPMNKLSLYHNDIKDQNILYNNENDQMRIIDWGLSSMVNDPNIIPSKFLNRPLQFNIPFSIILFNEKFNKYYASQLQELNYTDRPSLVELKRIVFNYINEYNLMSKGHGQYIIKLLSNLLINKNLPKQYVDNSKYSVKNGAVLNILLDYNATVLLEFTDFTTGEFLANKYFTEIYSKNVDIWGFTTINLEYIINSVGENFLSSNNFNEFQKEVLNILFQTIFSSNYAIKPIDINLLVDNILSLNDILEKNTITDKIKSVTKNITRKITKKVGFKDPSADPSPSPNPSPIPSPNPSPNSSPIPSPIPSPSKNIVGLSQEKSVDYPLEKDTKIKSTRCPKGTRRNRKTGECDKIDTMLLNTKNKIKPLEKILNKQLNVINISQVEPETLEVPIDTTKQNIESKNIESKNVTKRNVTKKNVSKTRNIEISQKLSRCKKGYRRVPPKTGKCIPNVKNIEEIDIKMNIEVPKEDDKNISSVDISIKEKVPRCKKGYRRVPPKTGVCVPK